MLGPAQIWMMPWDVFILLEGGWHILNGQVPHIDFYNPIGSMTYGLTALGMKISGGSVAACMYASIVFLLVTGPWAAVVFFRKLAPPLAFAVVAFIATMAVAPRPLGWGVSETTYAMVYNRYGWILLSVLFIQLFFADRAPSRWTGAFDAGSAGLLVGFAFYCKFNFFVVAVAAVLLALILRRELRAYIALMLLSLLLVAVVFFLTLGVRVPSYFADIMVALRSQSPDMRFRLLRHAAWVNLPQIMLIGIAWLAVVAPSLMRRQMRRQDAWLDTIVVAFIVGSALLTTIGNTLEHNEVPLLGVAVLYLFQTYYRQEAIYQRGNLSKRSSNGPVLAWAAALGLLFGPIFIRDAGSLATEGFHASAGTKFEAPRLSDFVIPDGAQRYTAYSRAAAVPAEINDGLALLRQHMAPGSKIVTLAASDPFSLALGTEPARGAPIWWDMNLSFNMTHYPVPQHLFAEADYVIYPIIVDKTKECCPGTMTLEALSTLYMPYLDRHYTELGRSPHWVVLKRAKPDRS
jgi:hypothetical protein